MTDSQDDNGPEALRADARRSWEGAAAGWAKWDALIAGWMPPGTEALMEMAGVAPGRRLLDLACGAGSQTLIAAGRVGQAGSVVASDISRAMLGQVAARAAAAGLANVTTLEGAAEELALEPATFDAAICRLGLMLFAEPGRALAAVRPALKPGGRMAALVFTTAEKNPFMAAPRAIARRLAGMAPPPPDAPGAFTLGGPGTLAGLFAAAGYADYRERRVAIEVRLAAPGEGIRLMLEASGSYRALLADCAEAVQEAILAEVAAFLSGFETAEGLRLPGEVMVGAGANPD